MRLFGRCAAALFVCCSVIPAQRKVDPQNLYERVLAVVPVVGTGSAADPKRPKYAPAPGQMSAARSGGIIGFTQVLSDDGKFALVEFVARDRAALSAVLGDAAVKKFEKGRDKREDAEKEFSF